MFFIADTIIVLPFPSAYFRQCDKLSSLTLAVHLMISKNQCSADSSPSTTIRGVRILFPRQWQPVFLILLFHIPCRDILVLRTDPPGKCRSAPEKWKSYEK